MALSFLHPGLLWGLGAVAAPIFVHLMGRHRAPEVPFAAFDFLLAATVQLAQRERLRQWLLLLLRCLVLVALTLALARPSAAPPAPAAVGPRALALVLDASASMAYRQGETSLWAQAQARARALMAERRPGELIYLVVAGREIRSLLAAPSSDRAALGAALATVQPDGVADLGAAVAHALAPFGPDGHGLTLAIVSDLARNSAASLRPLAQSPLPKVQIWDAAGRPTPVPLANVGLESVQVGPSPGQPYERRLQVVVRNWGAQPVQQLPLLLRLAGQVVQRSYVDLAPFGTAGKTMTHAFAAPGIYPGELRLAATGDGLAADDAVDFSLEVARAVRVLAVNGAPRSTPHEDELFFLERALGTLPTGDAPIHLRSVHAADLGAAAEQYAGVDVVVLANVGLLTAAQVGALSRFVDGGGGLLIGLGDGVQFESANAALASLLPTPLRDVHAAADRGAATPPLAIGEVDVEHPLLRGLGSAFATSLRSTRTRRYFNLDVGMVGRAEALMRFDNGAPALVLARPQTGRRGRVLMWTSSLDVDDTDLALRSAYPPLMQHMMRYLAQVPQDVLAAPILPNIAESDFAATALTLIGGALGSPDVAPQPAVPATEAARAQASGLLLLLLFGLVGEGLLAARG